MNVVTYHLRVPQLQTVSRIEELWPNMPMMAKTKVIMEVIDKAIKVYIIKSYNYKNKKREKQFAT